MGDRRDVSRETFAELQCYADLLSKWQRAYNLVAPSTLNQMWQRHFLDSAQLVPLIPPGSRVIDLGSGAGFPGLVLSTPPSVLKRLAGLIWLNRTKRMGRFLAEVIRTTSAPAGHFRLSFHGDRRSTAGTGGCGYRAGAGFACRNLLNTQRFMAEMAAWASFSREKRLARN